jgi:hypothetical protein
MTEISRISYFIILIFLICIIMNILPAKANGGDFFEELALHGLEENPNMGSPYFGFVRDSRGRGVNQAQVSFTYEKGTSIVQTNILGHYKQDGFDKSVDSNEVVIECKKNGFKQVRVERRIIVDRPLQPIEANCILQES